jgi:hypothetical protein
MKATRFIALTLAAMCAVFGAVWLYVALVPAGFLDDEYPRWKAKSEILASCDLGDVAVLGDSRATIDVMPREMGIDASNLAVAGGTPVELMSVARRILACPRLPRTVVISLTPSHFIDRSTFWEKSTRYHFVAGAELQDLLRAARQTGDWSFFPSGPPDFLPPQVRIWMAAHYFPSLYFAALVERLGFASYWRNEDFRRQVLADRGQYFFVNSGRGDQIGPEGYMPIFAAAPILDLYFDRVVRSLTERGIAVHFVAMPYNDVTAARLSPAMMAGFAAHLQDYARKYPGFDVLGRLAPSWPDTLFNDALLHLNRRGAPIYSAQLAACLKDRAACRDLGRRPALD